MLPQSRDGTSPRSISALARSTKGLSPFSNSGLEAVAQLRSRGRSALVSHSLGWSDTAALASSVVSPNRKQMRRFRFPPRCAAIAAGPPANYRPN